VTDTPTKARIATIALAFSLLILLSGCFSLETSHSLVSRSDSLEDVYITTWGHAQKLELESGTVYFAVHAQRLIESKCLATVLILPVGARTERDKDFPSNSIDIGFRPNREGLAMDFQKIFLSYLGIQYRPTQVVGDLGRKINLQERQRLSGTGSISWYRVDFPVQIYASNSFELVIDGYGIADHVLPARSVSFGPKKSPRTATMANGAADGGRRDNGSPRASAPRHVGPAFADTGPTLMSASDP